MQCRIELERTRLLVLEAANQLDQLGNKKARGILAMAKVNYVLSPESPWFLFDFSFLCLIFISLNEFPWIVIV